MFVGIRQCATYSPMAFICKDTMNSIDVSCYNAHILQAKVNTRDDDCLFTGLTSARLYRVDCEGLEGCTIVISGDK